jgi:DNA polymerase-1
MSATKQKRLFLIDGSAMFYRAYFAFIRNPLINSKGEDTSASFGLVNSLLKILREEEPDYIAVVFDTKHPTFRHEMYAEYKSTRAKMPDELVLQIPRIHQVVEALNIKSFELKGFEADDIIGTFARKGAEAGCEVWCVTGDKDFFQLVNDQVGVYTPRKASEKPDRLDREGVKVKFGVYPEAVIDKLALMGDTSDNVPGIPGVGPKTADKLLEQFGTLEAVLENHDQIKAKGVRQKVADNIDSAKMSKELVTIKTDVPIEFDLEQMLRRPPDFDTVRELFAELEFTRLAKQILSEAAVESVGAPDEPVMEAEPATQAYHLITSIAELKQLTDRLSTVDIIAVDTETTSLDPLLAELVGVSLSDAAGNGWYVPLGHSTDGDKNLPFDKALQPLKELLENKRIRKTGQNIKYDLRVLRRVGIEIEPVSFDTMLASFVINPLARRHSLDSLALQFCDHEMQPISDLIGSGKNQKTFDIVPVDKATDYAAEDADYTLRLTSILSEQVDKSDARSLYFDIELPLIKVLASMEDEGIRVDAKFLGELSVDMSTQLERIQTEVFKVAGGQFNINSTQQLGHILFDKLGLPTKGKTAKKTGYSTDVRVLEELAALHEFPKLILNYRQLTKLKSTYIDAIPKLINFQTGRVHTSFNQTIATTGRLSSTKPNLQNIPIRTDEGRQIRKAFIPRDKNHILLAADYSQIELRVLAHYTGDPSLIEAFTNNEDIHTRTASEVFEVAPEDVTRDQRRVAKTANFAIIYGVSAFGLSQQTEMSIDESRQFIDTYLARYPGIQTYMDDTIAFARENGYVTTMFGRHRHIPQINDQNRQARQFAERIAINTPIQGSAAEIIKIAMIVIDQKLKPMRTRMVLQVHDELVFDVHKKELAEVEKLVKTGMEQAVELKVPLIADMGSGLNWLEAK